MCLLSLILFSTVINHAITNATALVKVIIANNNLEILNSDLKNINMKINIAYICICHKACKNTVQNGSAGKH